MKKRILILMASFILVLSASYAKANDLLVPQTVSSVFAHDFSHASDVNWVMFDGYYKARFMDHGKILFAFYTPDGELMGTASNILSDRLPVSLQIALKNNYSGYWITDLFHYNINNTPGFFVTLENGDQKIMLKAEENQNWSFYSTVKKD